MNQDKTYRQTQVEFEDEWSRNTVEGLLITNDYPRAREERKVYEPFLPKDELILEAGCGLGPKLLYFQGQGYRMIGVDFVLSALRKLKKYDPKMRISCCDIHQFPFGDNTFGAYLSYGVVEHFPQGPEESLREAYRILKDGGILMIAVPAANALSRFIHDPDNFLQQLRENPLIRKLAGKPEYPCSDEHQLYMKLFEKEEMREILVRIGFKILKEMPVSHSFSLYMACECFQADHHGKTNIFAETVAWFLKKLAPWSTANHLMIVARK